MRFCKDCKWCNANLDQSLPYCDHPNNFEIDLVSGLYSRRYRYCRSHREDDFIASTFINTCGKRGRWFEGKD